MQKPYGTWPSPIAAAVVARQGIRFGGVAIDGPDVYWLEGRPDEGGRQVLVRRSEDGRTTEVTPPGFNVRTRVHEYGGGAFVVDQGLVCCANFSDQRWYRIGEVNHRRRTPPSSLERPPAPVPITPPGQWSYADSTVDAVRKRLICVREDHTESTREPVTTLVGVPLEAPESAGQILAAGYDFYSTPRISPDGSRLAWLAWRHPRMPWEGTELWVARMGTSGALEQAVRVAGGDDESIYQPGWSPDGTLHFVSDRNGWWRLYRLRDGSGTSDAVEPVLRNPPAAAEFGRPQWVFGTATWAFAGPARLVISYTIDGRWRLAVVDVATGTLQDLPTDLEPAEWLAATPTHAVLVAGSAYTADAVVRIALEDTAVETLRTGPGAPLDRACISVAAPMTVPANDGGTVHAFYYPPHHPDCVGPPGERPPLIAISHGGPTTAARATLDPKIQFWTSRGFAVVDVNYGGSSGYGRAYRQRLDGRWGIVDVADMVSTVQYLTGEGKADPARVIIRGGSAGGYTTLAALAFQPAVFKAGASYYGVSDIELLARDTHKFESRYLDTLVGPYPAARSVYRERSPIHFVQQIACPLILFQGLEDKVVPPNQSEAMADAVRANGWPVAYLAFAGEQHGFRRAETIVRTLEAELYFYGQVFGFSPADAIEPIPIDNLPTT